MNLNVIKESLSKATPGPWRDSVKPHTKNQDGTYRHIEAGIGYFDKSGDEKGFSFAALIAPADAHLIANAPQWIASLLSQVEEMQNTLEWYADKQNYDKWAYEGERVTNVTRDKGECARQTLQSLKGDKP